MTPEEYFDRWWHRWWHDEGSTMRPLLGEDAEAHVHRISRIAWMNGADIAIARPVISCANPDGEPAGMPDVLDFDVRFDTNSKEFHVWTPDETGAVIGIGKTEREALMNCVENLKLTIAAIQKPQ